MAPSQLDLAHVPQREQPAVACRAEPAAARHAHAGRRGGDQALAQAAAATAARSRVRLRTVLTDAKAVAPIRTAGQDRSRAGPARARAAARIDEIQSTCAMRSRLVVPDVPKGMPAAMTMVWPDFANCCWTAACS